VSSLPTTRSITSLPAPTAVDDPPSRVEETTPLAIDSCSIDFVTTFLTGVTIDTPQMLAQGFDVARAEIHRALESVAPGEWMPPDVPSSESLRYTVADQAGSSVLPPAFLSRTEDSLRAELAVALNNAMGGVDATARCPNGARWRLRRAQLDIHDFGTGSVALEFDVDLPRSLSVQELRTIVEDFSERVPQLVSRTTHVAAKTFSDVTAHVAYRSEEITNAPESVRRSHGANGAPLWVHRVYYLSAQESSQIAEHAAAAAGLCPSFFNTVHLGGYSVMPGILSSVAVSAPGCELNARALGRVLRLQDGWLAALIELDRTLFLLLNDLSFELRHTDTRELERMSAVIESIYSRFSLMRTGLATLLVNWGDRDVGIWEATSSVWRFDGTLKAVDEKLAVLQTLYTNTLAKISGRRERRLNVIALVFAAVSFVAAVAETLSFVEGAHGQIPQDERVAIVSVIGTLSAVVVFLLLFVTRRHSLRS
jgi:hypothetical protein